MEKINLVTPTPGMQWLIQNIDQTLNSENTNTSPLYVSYRVPTVNIWEEINLVIMAQHCTENLCKNMMKYLQCSCVLSPQIYNAWEPMPPGDKYHCGIFVQLCAANGK